MFEDYRKRMSYRGNNLSDVLRRQSDVVVNATWGQSVEYRRVIVKWIDRGLPQFNEDNDTILEAHFSERSRYNFTLDEVTYWLEFRPHEILSHPEIRIGSYVSIPDSDGVRKTWLIVHIDDDSERKMVQILETNWIFKWITDGKMYQTLGCKRYVSMNNVRLTDINKINVVDNIKGAILPTNNDTNLIGYNRRMLISDPGRVPPFAWSVSRIIDTAPIGLTKLVLEQATFDEVHDNAELGYADYYDSEIAPIPSEQHVDGIKIIYSGKTPTIKVGGSWKKFSVNDINAKWSVFDGKNSFNTSNDNYEVNIVNGDLKLKVMPNYNLIGNVLTVKVSSGMGDGEVEIEVV